MEILTAHTVNPDTQQAVSEALTQLLSTTDENIDLLIVYYTEVHDAAVLREALVTALPRVEMHGCSSCQGVMSQRGFHSEQGASLGLWAILDDDGDYGTAAVPLSNNLAETGERAVAEAMANAGRMGEVPELIWFSSTPGYEETLIESIQGVVGNNVPIAGGSAADNTVAGNWSLFNASQSLQEGLVVTLLYPSVNTSSAFLSGYSPTETSGVVTKAQGRTIIEIDGKPAAQVYNDWIGSPFEPKILDQGGNVLADTTLYPLGREASVVAGVQQFKLSHPDSITPTGGLTLFSDIAVGDKVVLMTGSQQSLVLRAGRVAGAAMEMGEFLTTDISGALVIYCAGCMLTVQDAMEDVSRSVDDALGGVPFLGAFTFGEQGCIESSGNAHGNLMISAVVFGK